MKTSNVYLKRSDFIVMYLNGFSRCEWFSIFYFKACVELQAIQELRHERKQHKD